MEETIAWLNREMRAPQGAYHAALDADTDGEEGLTYLWKPDQVLETLGGESGRLFCEAYGITSEGNFEHSGLSNPALLDADPGVRDSLEGARRQLLAARNRRPQPGRDDKLLTAWNALLVRGLAQAAFSFGRADWLAMARETALWIWDKMRLKDDRLHPVAYGDEPRGNGLLDDYAYSAEAFLAVASCVDWIHPGESALWIGRAKALVGSARRHFRDPDAAGFFYTSDDHESLVHRKKEWFDNATPSGNSSMVRCLILLQALDRPEPWADDLLAFRQALSGIALSAPSGLSHAFAALVHQAVGIATIKLRPGTGLEPLLAALAARPWRPVFLLQAVEGELTASYQLCIGSQCLAPTDSVEEVAANI